MMLTAYKRQQAFTLIEIIIAMAIAGLIGVAAMGLLDSATMASKGIQERGDRYNDIERALLFMSNDIQQLAPRQFRDQFGDKKGNLISDDSMGKTYISFTRLGRRNPAGLPRSNLEKLIYIVDEEPPKWIKRKIDKKGAWLKRISFAYPDGMNLEEGVSRVLLDNVESLKAAFYDGEVWSDIWPVDNGQRDKESANRLPIAVKISLKLNDLGLVERLYILSDRQEGS